MLYKPGHIGAYLGKEKTVKQGVVNCVECTPAWDDGIQYSYVDEWGFRRYYKGGPAAGAWTHHGKPSKWIDYKDPEPERRKIFSDIREGDPGWQEAEWCKDNGIFKGYSDGSFRPDDSIKRIDIARVLYRIFNTK